MSKPKQSRHLSVQMRRIIDTMNSGSGYWEAVHTGGFAGGCVIQEGKIGYGGKSERINCATFFALYHRGVFVQAEGGTEYERHWKLAPKYRRDQGETK